MGLSKWALVEQASNAKRRGDKARYERLLQKIREYDAKCKHRRNFMAECGTESPSDFGTCLPGDTIRICDSCGKILARIPVERRSGVRLRV